MSKPWIHAQSSAKKFGGIPEDYLELHSFMDSSKSAVASNAHRALTHNSWFISTVIPRVYGEVFPRASDGKMVSSRDIAEQHVAEDYANQFIPSAQDFLENMEFKDWMQNGMGPPPSFAKIIGKRKIKQIPMNEIFKPVEDIEEPAQNPDPIDMLESYDGSFKVTKPLSILID